MSAGSHWVGYIRGLPGDLYGIRLNGLSFGWRMGLGVTLPRPRPCQVCMRLQVIPHFTRLYIITTNERGKATDGESISIRAHKTAP